MKIEFHCESCDSLLRIAERLAGEAIDCPACHTLQWVPRVSRVQPTVAPRPSPPRIAQRPAPQHREIPPASKSLDRDCPECQAPVSSRDSACSACGTALEPERDWNPTAISAKEIIQDAWAVYVDNLWLLVGASLIEGVVILIGWMLILIPAVLAAGAIAPLGNPVLIMLTMIGMLGLGLIIQRNLMVASFCKFHLKVVRGERVSVFDSIHIEWRRGGVSLLPTVYGFMFISGLMILLVPGLFVFLVFWPYCWVWADNKIDKSELQALPLARELTTRNMGTSMILAIIGAALFFVHGLAFPFSHSLKGVLQAVAYLRMSGQTIPGRPDRSRDV